MQILKEKNQILENSSFCYIDENVLSGYLVASETIAKKTGICCISFYSQLQNYTNF